MVAEPKSAALPLGYSPSKIPAPTPTTPARSSHPSPSHSAKPRIGCEAKIRVVQLSQPIPVIAPRIRSASASLPTPAKTQDPPPVIRATSFAPAAFSKSRAHSAIRGRKQHAAAAKIIPTRKRNYRRFQPACQPRPLNPRIISAINLRRPRRNPRMRQRNPTPFPLRIIRRRNLLPDPRNPCRAKAGKKKRNVRPQLRPQLRQPRARKPQTPQPIQPQQNRRRIRTRPPQAPANRRPLRHRNVRPRMRRPRLRPQRQSGADAQIIRHPRMRPRPPNLPIAARRNFHRVAKLQKRRVRLQQMHPVVAPPDNSQTPINFRRRGKFKSHSPPSSFAAAACFKLTDAVPPGNFASIRVGFPPSSRAANSISHPC